MKFPKLFLLLACAGFGVLAQEAGPIDRIKLTPKLINDLAEEARTNNAAIWAARARAAAAGHHADSIPLWRDPEAMIGGMASETMMREEDGDIVYGVEQMLPVFGKEKAARKVARKEIGVANAEVEISFQLLRRTLAEALFKAALADERLELAQRDLAWAETLLLNLEQRYPLGEVSQVDLLRVQNETSRRAQLVRTGENDREAAYVTVNRLLNRNLISGWAAMELPDVAGPLPPLDTLMRYAIKFEPRLQRMRKEVEAAEAIVESSRKEMRPDLAAAVQARQYSRTGEGRSAEVMLRMTLPWFNRDKYRAAVRRDQARVDAVNNEIEDYSYELRSEIHHLVMIIENARREAVLYRDEIIPRSEQALASAEAAWQAGSDRFRDVLDASRLLIEARANYLKAVADQYIALSDLVLCCGIGDLEALQKLVEIGNPEEDRQ